MSGFCSKSRAFYPKSCLTFTLAQFIALFASSATTIVRVVGVFCCVLMPMWAFCYGRTAQVQVDRLCDGSIIRPSVFCDPGVNRGWILNRASTVLAPLDCRLRLTKCPQQPAPSLIPGLRLLICESAIVGRVGSVVVYTVDRQTWAVSLTQDPVDEFNGIVSPLWNDEDTTTAVQTECRVIYISAAIEHGFPISVQPQDQFDVRSRHEAPLRVMPSPEGDGRVFSQLLWEHTAIRNERRQ